LILGHAECFFGVFAPAALLTSGSVTRSLIEPPPVLFRRSLPSVSALGHAASPLPRTNKSLFFSALPSFFFPHLPPVKSTGFSFVVCQDPFSPGSQRAPAGDHPVFQFFFFSDPLVQEGGCVFFFGSLHHFGWSSPCRRAINLPVFFFFSFPVGKRGPSFFPSFFFCFFFFPSLSTGGSDFLLFFLPFAPL